jgi:hypothetical protein
MKQWNESINEDERAVEKLTVGSKRVATEVGGCLEWLARY